MLVDATGIGQHVCVVATIATGTDEMERLNPAGDTECGLPAYVDASSLQDATCIEAEGMYQDHHECQMTRYDSVDWIQPRLIDCEGFDCLYEEARR